MLAETPKNEERAKIVETPMVLERAITIETPTGAERAKAVETPIEPERAMLKKFTIIRRTTLEAIEAESRQARIEADIARAASLQKSRVIDRLRAAIARMPENVQRKLKRELSNPSTQPLPEQRIHG